ncbi:pyrroloquinoline quinone biosynthesis protein PqqB [Halomonas shantousis]
MHVLVLGSAAGGGFPQWNCNCANCRGARNGSITPSRTQSSIAISSDGERWLLCNASPDIRAQMAHNPEFHPRHQLRGTGLAGVLLVDAQIDHVTGLLSLREGCPLDVWCTPNVHQDLSTGFPLFPMLEHWQGGLRWRSIDINASRHEVRFEIDCCPGLNFTAIALDSNAPPYSPRRGAPTAGDNLGLFIEDSSSGAGLFYAPGLGRLNEGVRAWLQRADCVLVDGTLWHDDEMQRLGVGRATGVDMGHLALAGEQGLISELDRLPAATRRILIHINNTNPILDDTSAERAVLEAHGIEVAHDGMRLAL